MMQQSQLKLNVQAPYLDHLRSGAKTHEGRLAHARYLALKTGDLIEIRANQNALVEHASTVDSSIFEVLNVTRYSTFREMLLAHGLQHFLPGNEVEDVDAAVNVYRSFPGYADGERELGVVAIEVKIFER